MGLENKGKPTVVNPYIFTNIGEVVVAMNKIDKMSKTVAIEAETVSAATWHPVLFDMQVWRSALLQLSGDEGARQILRQQQDVIHYIELSEGQIFLDVDTQLEYNGMQQLWKKYRKK